MQTVAAIPQVTTRLRPAPQLTERPSPEPITSHAATCPICGRETRLALRPGTVYGSCPHFTAIEAGAAGVTVLFEAGKAA